MINPHSSIFISYAWGGTREIIVDHVYDLLNTKNYNIIRDKVDLGYRGNIEAFMKTLGAGKAIIIVLSERYLKARNCMYEAVQIRDNGNMAKRIFPILLKDADIYNDNTRKQYVSFWQEENLKLQSQIKNMSNLTYLGSIAEEIILYDKIKNFIDAFVEIVSKMKVSTPQERAQFGLTPLINDIDNLLSDDQTQPRPIGLPSDLP